MLRNIAAVLWIALGVAVGLFILQIRLSSNESTIRSHHTGPTIEQVQALATLTLSKVEVADVQETSIQGYTGGIRAIIVAKGDFLLGTDLTKARFDSVDATTKTAVLVLPQPTLASPRVDHARTRLYDISRHGLWQITPGSQPDTTVLNQAYREAQQLVADAARNPDLIARSRQQAEKVLSVFFEALGWKVTVRWENSG